jgi:uncharacterized protein YndB with AHSA1/START domain
VNKPHKELSPGAEANELELVVTRVFDAPRDLVFKAWTEPERLVRWWGPRGFTVPSCEADFRPGGAYRLLMRSPEGREVWWHGVCREIVPPERIVLTCTVDEANGDRISSETLLTVTLEEYQGKTKLTLRQGVFDSLANRERHQSGWNDALGCLTEYLAAA